MGLILNVLVTGFAVWLASAILPGVTVRNFLTAIWVGLLIGLITATLGFILKFITFPINWITLGLIHFLINVLMIMLVDKIVKGFQIKSFGWAILFALLIAAINGLVYWII